jgi:mannosyl-3-phosphoglycerate phosphatase
MLLRVAVMKMRPSGGNFMNRPWAIFTDLDGTLLNSQTFDFDAAVPVIEKLRNAGVPIVPVTSRTLEEVEPLAHELGLDEFLIVEAGAGIARRNTTGWQLEIVGRDAESMLQMIHEIELASDAQLNLYSVMRRDDAARHSGLTVTSVAASQRRFCDEPFVIAAGRVEDVAAAAKLSGFSLRHDGRLFHLCGPANNGAAVKRVAQELGCNFTVGIGDSEIDLDFLLQCDIRIVVPQPNGALDATLISKLPEARVAPAAAPHGWAVAVASILDELSTEHDSPLRDRRTTPAPPRSSFTGTTALSS